MESAEPGPMLTPRQMEVLGLVARGWSNRRIAAEIGLSVNTVKVHVAAILDALGVANRTEAAAHYQRLLESADGTARARAAAMSRIGRPALAVLRFDDAGAAGSDHLAEALAETLIERLSAWRWFPLIAHDSSRRYADAPDAREAGKRLGASYLITGHLKRDGVRLRVNVHLLEAARGQVLWSQIIETGAERLPDAADGIARLVVAAIAPELVNVEGSRRIDLTAAANPDVWQTTVRGMWHLNRQTPADVQQALVCFDEALASQPDYALAWYGSCLAHQHLLWEQRSNDPAATLAALARAAAECLRSAPDTCQAQTVAGLAAVLRGDRDGAIAHFERALSINPCASQALSLLGQCYGLAGRNDECIAALEESISLNPLSRLRWMYQASIGMAHYVAGRYDEAARWAERAIGEGGDQPSAMLVLAAALSERGLCDDARRVALRLAAAHPRFDLDRHLATVGASSPATYVERFRAALARVGLT